MMAPSKITMAGVLAVLAAAPLVDAHGYMSVPKVTFATSGDPTQFCATMDGPSTLTAPSGMSFTTDPASNTKAFTAAMKAQTTYASMRALVDAKATFVSGMDKQCGVTSPTGAKQPLPDKYVEWAHSSSEGFTASHQGPCEVWCDDKMAFQDDNCAADYTTAPALLPYDKTKCTGASMLKIYWLALHSSTWQAYINCAPLEGGSGSSSSTTPSVTPTSTTKAPAATTTAPAASSDDEYDTTPAPATTTSKPAASGSEDCDDDLDIKDSSSGSVGADEDCDGSLDIAGSDDCDDDLDIADTKAPSAASSPSSSTTTSPASSGSATTTAPSSSDEYDDEYATPAPASTTATPASTTAPSSSDEYDDEYATPTPSSTGEVGGDADDEVGADADTGSSEDCDDDLDIKDSAAGSVGADEDCDDDLDIKDSSSGSVGADEDCEGSLDVAGSDDEDCELDVAGSSSTTVKTSDLDFSSVTTSDKSEVGTVDAY